MAFIRCDLGSVPADHHTLAMALQPHTGYVHSAYELTDLDEVAASGEYLRERGYRHAWGLGRHIQGSQIFDYWRDPDRAMFEHYTDGDVFDATMVPGWAPLSRLAPPRRHAWGRTATNHHKEDPCHQVTACSVSSGTSLSGRHGVCDYREKTQLKGDDVAFVMRDEWKEEPVSTTGAEYVEPSATELIKPGQRVSHLFPRMIIEEFVLQRVTERVWWVSRQFYGSLFYVGKRGVLLFDPFLGGADATLAAIASVTPTGDGSCVLALPRRPRRRVAAAVRTARRGAAAGDRIGAHRHLDVAVPVGPPPPDRRPRLAVGRCAVR